MAFVIFCKALESLDKASLSSSTSLSQPALGD